ncbi:MAG TPA: Ig-like domain-containing protein, partial [Acidimicrobiales bacterium]|nr:Ig-like domain-containing protein [Acidimicrobiales bacterium]
CELIALVLLVLAFTIPVHLSASAANGATWLPSTAPTSGLNPAPNSSSDITNYDTACASNTRCVAVGNYVGSASTYDGLIETGTYSGSSWAWTAVTAPASGLVPPASATADVWLYGVSCPTTTSCIAVGYYSDSSGGIDGLIVTGAYSGSSWNWTPTSAPDTPLTPSAISPPDYSLNDVSCPSTTSCFAVGRYYDVSSNPEGLIETGIYSGSSWSWKPSTVPTTGLSPPSNGSPDISPLGVSCPTSSTCLAVGNYLDTSSHFEGLIETGSYSGSSWTWAASTAPTSGLNPAQSASPNVSVAGISCPTPISCVGDGYYRDSANYTDGLIETGSYSGSSWTWAASTAPTSGLNPVSSASPQVELHDVSCPSTTFCVGSGSYPDSSHGLDGLFEVGTHSNSGWTWTPNAAPLSSGLNPASNSTPDSVLYGVSCPTTLTCAAVGFYNDAATNIHGLIETGIFPVVSTTTLRSSRRPSEVGKRVTFTANVAGTSPTGTITFLNGTKTMGSATLGASGTAVFATSSLSVGSHVIVATYSGDTFNQASSSANFKQIVVRPPFPSIVNPLGGIAQGSVVFKLACRSRFACHAIIQLRPPRSKGVRNPVLATRRVSLRPHARKTLALALTAAGRLTIPHLSPSVRHPFAIYLYVTHARREIRNVFLN